jgi:malonyl-CoA/methylmalonyl-CoA synthetase
VAFFIGVTGRRVLRLQVSQADLQEFAKGRLPKYQVPNRVVVMEKIPRNAMGKINKKALRKELFPDDF